MGSYSMSRVLSHDPERQRRCEERKVPDLTSSREIDSRYRQVCGDGMNINDRFEALLLPLPCEQIS
jgi:hypothetical protein